MPDKRPKFTVEQQVAHMKASGIRFELFSESEARSILENRNYFFEVETYDNSFDKFTNHDHPEFGRYVDLDFAYLVKLSRLGHALRYAIMPAALDIEHFLKVHLNRTVTADAEFDGYDIVESYLKTTAERKLSKLVAETTPNTLERFVSDLSKNLFHISQFITEGEADKAIAELDATKDAIETSMGGMNLRNTEKSIDRLTDSSYSRKLAAKYGPTGVSTGDVLGTDSANMPFWAFLELTSFGDTIGLYKHYFIDLRGGADFTTRRVKPLLFPAKALRNAAAHNSRLLHDLRGRMAKPVGRIASLMKGDLHIDPDLVARTRRAPAVHDLGALLLTHDAVVHNCSTKQAHRNRLTRLATMYSENLTWFAKQPEVHDCLALMAAMFAALARGETPGD